MVLFQFLYGSIKARMVTAKYTPVFNFNSSMVRLKHYRVFATGSGTQVFQFLYGSIKADHGLIEGFEIHEFQFLYGSIKAG